VPNSMLEQVTTLPGAIRSCFDSSIESIASTVDACQPRALDHLYLVGCGDSHHAALATELAFEFLSGVPTRALTSLHCSRYLARQLASRPARTTMAVGISVSGQVARTIEAIGAARRGGAVTVALTKDAQSPAATAADHVTVAPIPDSPPGPPGGTPGVHSYACNQIVLLRLAVRLGQARGHLTTAEARGFDRELRTLADGAARVIEHNDRATQALASETIDAEDFVFLGGGPNYGTALFSAAKLIEACGDAAVGQDTEEWAHLQYYARRDRTPTFVISPGGRDQSRALEIVVAARAVGRRVVTVMPTAVAAQVDAARALTLPASVREMFVPVVASIPATLFAAHRSTVLGETFFRSGRGIDVSRIRTSEISNT